MRIGVVTTSYPRFAGDAAGSFVAGHVAYLRAQGHDVEVIAAGAPLPTYGLFYQGGAPDAIEAGASRIALARFSLAMGAEVWRRARRWDATVAHWWVPCAAAAAVVGAPRLLAIAHGGDVVTARRARVLAPVAAALVARRARVVFVSRALRDTTLASLPAPLARRIDDAAIVQPMGVDLARFTAIARAPVAGRVVVLARLVPIKGVATAIEAMRALPRAHLIVAGDGPLRAALAAAAPANVELRGAVDASARDELLRTAAVVVVPSIELAGRSEGTPLAAIEALAAGVPVIASATGGLRDLPVAHVPPGDPRALAAAIDQALAEARTAPRGVAATYDWAAVGATLDAHWHR